MDRLAGLTLATVARVIIGFTMFSMGGDTLRFLYEKGFDVWADRGGGAIGFMARTYHIGPEVFAVFCIVCGLAMFAWRQHWPPVVMYFLPMPIILYAGHSIPPLLESDAIANAPAILYGGLYALTLALLFYGREVKLFNDD